MSWLKHLLTGRDNETHDIGRHSWMLCTVVVIGGAIWNAWHANAMNLREFAEAIGLVIGAHGAVLWAKRDTEPPPKP